MLIKFDTWDISRLELWLNLQAAQHTCSSRGQVLRAIRNQEHRVPPITRITNKHYLPYTVRLISTTMCPFTVCLLHISCIFLHTFVSENVKLFLQTWQQKQETRQASRNLHRKTREVSSAVQIRSSLFWHVTQRRLVVTDVSGQPIGPIFNGQAVRTTGPETSLITSLRCLTTQKSEVLIDNVQFLRCRTEKIWDWCLVVLDAV